MEYTVYNKNNESMNQYIHVQEMSALPKPPVVPLSVFRGSLWL